MKYKVRLGKNLETHALLYKIIDIIILCIIYRYEIWDTCLYTICLHCVTCWNKSKQIIKPWVKKIWSIINLISSKISWTGTWIIWKFIEIVLQIFKSSIFRKIFFRIYTRHFLKIIIVYFTNDILTFINPNIIFLLY